LKERRSAETPLRFTNQKQLGFPIKFVGLGEQAEDLQPFDAKQFAQALFEE